MSTWANEFRPGFFGRRRDEKIAGLNQRFGNGGWRLAWVVHESATVTLVSDFVDACKTWYEASYVRFFEQNPAELEHVCSFGEVIDNALSNVESGLDYAKQEAFSTHIQDIAIRNVLVTLGRWFLGPRSNLLTVRGEGTNGARYNPGKVPFIRPEKIMQPSIAPSWAQPGSVEDFWQSNKWVQVRR